MTSEFIETALKNCAKEEIHIPGAVQARGALLAGPDLRGTVFYCSDNISKFLETTPKAALSLRFDQLFDAEVLHSVGNVLSQKSIRRQRQRVHLPESFSGNFELFVHINFNEMVVLEIEEASAGSHPRRSNPLDEVRMLLGRLGFESDVLKALKVAVTGLGMMTGYDRVMACKFISDGSGEVVCDYVRGDLQSYLGHRFPAADIPEQARHLMKVMPVRFIHDVNEKDISILRSKKAANSLDLSLAASRGVSDVHRRYLRNMRIRSSMTVSIMVKDKLWGFLACHHGTPVVLESDVFLAVDLFGQMISLLITKGIEHSLTEARDYAERIENQLVASVDETDDLIASYQTLLDLLKKSVQCKGVALVRDNKVITTGQVPEPALIRKIAALYPEKDRLVLSTDSLVADQWIESGEDTPFAGCLFLHTSTIYPLQILFFRTAIEQNEILWAGDPEKKEVEDSEFGFRLSPRGSFESYKQLIHGRSEPWTAEDLVIVEQLLPSITRVALKSERAQLERHRNLLGQQRQQELLIAELNHRVKNILALVRSMSRQAQGAATSVEGYARAIEQRISALATAHDMIASGISGVTALNSLILAELKPYSGKDDGQVIMTGVEVGVRAEIAPMLSLVFHEVVTNAAKYGALSTTDGVVKVQCNFIGEDVEIVWREIGGPKVMPPAKSGFGRSLIEKAIPYEFGGESEVFFNETGVSARFVIPGRYVTEFGGQGMITGTSATEEVIKSASGMHMLLVEDNLLLAMDMVESIKRLGADSVETANSLKAAEKLLHSVRVDFAVLDMNLGGEVSFSFAKLLAENNIPFIFVTGYGSALDLPQNLAGVPILTKPVDFALLSRTIQKVLSTESI